MWRRDVPKLTPKQEAFALKYIETNNASEAYRQCYDVSPDSMETTIWVNAHKVLANAKVAQRVLELQERAAKRTLVTVESLCAELDGAIKMATEEKQASAVTGAVMGKARLHGLDVKKTENKHEIEDKRMQAMIDDAPG